MLRKENGISQAELADKLELSKKTIERLERGENNPKMETVCALANYFSVSVDYLLGKEEYHTGEKSKANEKVKGKNDSLTNVSDVLTSDNISATERMLWRCAIENIKIDANGGWLVAEINTVEQISGLDFSEIESCAYRMLQKKIVEKNGTVQILMRSTLRSNTLRFVFNPSLRKEILAVSEHIEEWY